ncbi:unnamed protein product [Dracunculus medinensis]|uniref:Acyl-coenzyme A oxidase n=1 Tax=Dracunculus medinensis TaxID=318479 RepID=A0A158Q5D5_DRAME|nr:unnamed protein product [Dracunculus medinensis]
MLSKFSCLTEERNQAKFSPKLLSEILYGKEAIKRRRKIAAFVEKTSVLHDQIPKVFMDRMERIENIARKVIFQKNIWFKRALNREILGTYAQTEIGHGNNLRGLETVAIYNKNSDEIIVNSPTITSYKWFIGNAGIFANYAIVVAKLIINDENMGLQNFIVQLRDEITHKPMHGITIGDIGPKFGMNSNDNGFIKFDNVRIPRRQMLMAFTKLTEYGELIKPMHEKLGYISMVRVRSMMTQQQAFMLAKACTIAVRYSCIRKQGEIMQNKGEVKLIDYQLQQYRILPQLANAFVFWFAAKKIRQTYQNMQNDIIDSLNELHSLSSGLKALITEEVGRGIESCRLCCGANGYSHLSGLPELYTTAIAGNTYEGDNTVLLLQLARLARLFFSTIPMNSLVHFKLIFIYIILILIKFKPKFASLNGEVDEILNNNDGYASRLHVKVYLLLNMINCISEIEDKQVFEAMSDILKLFILHELISIPSYIESGCINVEQLNLIRSEFYKMLKKVRRNAIALTDSFDINDREINSLIATNNENIYKNILQWTNYSQLNNKVRISVELIEHISINLNSDKISYSLRHPFIFYLKHRAFLF